MIDAEIHEAVMALPPDERRDRTKVNEAVREGLRLGPLRPAGPAMQRKTQSDLENGLKVGDRVRLIAESLAWKAEMTLQGQVGEVIERRDKPTAPASPWQNGFAERLIGSIRRECCEKMV